MSSSNLSINESKRELSEHVSSNMKIKKSRKSRFDLRKEITCIENLSNEIFYEIFDYLDGSDIFYGFLSLNIRFNNLINHSSLSIKISRSTSFSDMSNRHYQQLIIANRHRIISLHLQDKLHTSFFSLLLSNNELLNRLESLILDKIQYDILMSLVRSLTILPRLFSLTIYLKERERDLEKLYSLIFGLPMLKYNKLSIIQHGIVFPFRLYIGQFSPVEHLVLDYSLTVLELYKILLFTPHLTHLSCKCLSSHMSISKELPINTFNLRYISFEDCSLNFDDFEILSKNLFSQIRILHYATSSGHLYCDLERWQRLILQFMPHLQILNFKYHELFFIGRLIVPHCYSLLSRLIPSFWTERKWFFEFEFLTDMNLCISTNFYIQPLKKQWYDLPNDITYSTITQQNCINTSFLCLRLVLTNDQQSSDYLYLEKHICPTLDTIQFTSLHITLNQFSVSSILKFLHRVPNLDSLTITSEFQGKKSFFSEIRTNISRLASTTHNKITKLSIEQINELTEVHLLLEFCPSLRYLQLKCRNISDAEWLIQDVLTKQNTNFIPHLGFICLWLCNADDGIVNNLQRLIYSEKLVNQYRIMRICDRIYLQRNEQV